ncbi:EthD domain-containing protein [Pedobacter sp. L105]|uniref:EthD domain-containing protein n=1 Tax=Pedobacter sp. L105 TaxID=1641871 RepID=UPI00131E69BF|nr:EthD domain-containing protein [Pedobacter sp. L105]
MPDFVSCHKNNYAALFASLPEVKQYVRRYVQCHSLPVSIPGLPLPEFDGITEIWFDNADSIEKVFGSKDYMELIRPDQEKFLDMQGCSFLISTEHIVI